MEEQKTMEGEYYEPVERREDNTRCPTIREHLRTRIRLNIFRINAFQAGCALIKRRKTNPHIREDCNVANSLYDFHGLRVQLQFEPLR
jgi:hypothetical protein